MHAVGLATYAASIVLLFLGTLYRAPVAVAGVLCMYGLDQLGQVSSGWLLGHQAFSNYVVGALLVVGFLRRGGAIVAMVRDCPKQTWLVLALYGYALVSLAWTRVPEVGWQQWLGLGPYIVAFALACPLLISDSADMRLALRWTVFIGGAISVVMLVFGEWGIRGLVVDASSVDETNPLALSTFAGTVAAATLFVGLGRKGWLEGLLRLVGVVVCVVLIVRSGSRGQLLAVVTSLALMLPIRYQLANIRGLIPAVLACVAIVVALDIGSSLYAVNDESRWTGAQATADVSGRFAMVGVLLSEWSRSAISIVFGLGTSASFDPKLIGIYLHNMPAEVLGEEGLIGAALLLSILISAGLTFIRARRFALPQPRDAEVLAASGAAAMFCLVLSLKQGSLLSNYLTFMTVVLAARVAIAIRSHVASAETSDTAPVYEPPRQFANLLR